MLDSQHNKAAPDISIERKSTTDSSENLADGRALQSSLLDGVSRTFALTIPQLPDGLQVVVSNAYLLCRTIDTIEDEPNLSPAEKKEFSDLFLEVLQGNFQAKEFSSRLAPLLSNHSIPAEHQLIKELNKIIAITNSFDVKQQSALFRCIRIMSAGMVYFQQREGLDGLKDQAEMDKYCYHVAGVVGEMLCELFCHYSQDIAKHKDELFNLSASFGQGLQMTNILKDIWDDQKRGACWLPRDLFEQHGILLSQLENVSDQKDFQQCLSNLVGIAHGHLENALKYTLLIPPQETGIRRFCLWAIGMAMMTLGKIEHNLGFTESEQVKITRRNVKTVIVTTGLFSKVDLLLKLLFKWTGLSLPKTTIRVPLQTSHQFN